MVTPCLVRVRDRVRVRVRVRVRARVDGDSVPLTHQLEPDAALAHHLVRVRGGVGLA